MADQLSLELPAELPALPTGLRPMEARPLAEPFDSPEHVFQPLWGGCRVLVSVARRADESPPADHVLRIVGSDGVDRSPRLPELATLADQVDARSAVLDGELVVVDGSGRLDPDALEERLAGESRRPALVLAFDLLHLDGRSLLGLPLHRRRDLLRRIVRPGGALLVLPGVDNDGRALHAAVTAQGLAGVLARLRSSPYLPGVRSRLWRFVPAGRRPAPADAVSPDADLDRDRPGAERPGAERPSTPILAVISRLPLEET
ncbi:MAG TPA: hypothetical protein VNO86_08765 [Candidatus Binatia bacterium]|nr:hypothetical protein [Candidatus Binatia bacterium]